MSGSRINLKTRLRAIKVTSGRNYFTEQIRNFFYEITVVARLDTFEMWKYRSMLIISLTANIANKVLRRMIVGREKVRQFRMRKLQYLGLLTRYNTSNRRKMTRNDGAVRERHYKNNGNA